MITYLTNKSGKILYKNPENIKKANRRRKDKTHCLGLLKYDGIFGVYKVQKNYLFTE